MVYMVARSPLGISNLTSISFKTGKLSYGSIIRIPLIVSTLNNIVDPDDVITALSKTLRI